MAALLDVDNVAVRYPIRGGVVRAVDGVSLVVQRSETLGIVGESGCGKSTLGRAMLRLIDVDAGAVRFDGVDLAKLGAGELRALRRRMQIVFQDPYASLNPRMSIRDIIAEGIDIHRIAKGDEREQRVRALVQRVGLDDELLDKTARELSGGMRQRVGIARALAVEPQLLVCDEPVSALDASVRAQVVNLLADLRDALGLTVVFIAHDLAVVKHLSTRVAVMYLGKIVELGPTAEIFEHPRHPYTRLLLASAPRIPHRENVPAPMAGEPASALAIPSGCRFRTRCPEVEAKCADAEPPLVSIGATSVACIHAS
ncbi:MAG TPA: ABC transporter ATP-binding protein [Myxococcota bacterium]|jgi:oligopeptide/dipeptide ABC transporter ATP-binding protein